MPSRIWNLGSHLAYAAAYVDDKLKSADGRTYLSITLRQAGPVISSGNHPRYRAPLGLLDGWSRPQPSPLDWAKVSRTVGPKRSREKERRSGVTCWNGWSSKTGSTPPLKARPEERRRSPGNETPAASSLLGLPVPGRKLQKQWGEPLPQCSKSQTHCSSRYSDAGNSTLLLGTLQQWIGILPQCVWAQKQCWERYRIVSGATTMCLGAATIGWDSATMRQRLQH